MPVKIFMVSSRLMAVVRIQLREYMSKKTLEKSHTTIGSWAVAVGKALASYGVESQCLADEFNIDLSAAERPNYRINADDMGCFYEAALLKSEDTAFALRVAKHTSPATFHALGFAALASDNVANLIKLVQQYAGVLSERASISLESKGDNYWLTLQVPKERPVGSHLAIEAVMAAMFYFTKYFQHVKKIQLLQVHFKSDSLEKEKTYREFFDCPVVFSSHCNGFVFPVSAIDKKLPMANEAVANASIHVVEEYLSELTTDDFLKAVQQHIQTQLLMDISQEAVAKALCMSVRTLQRRLLDLGFTFREVVEDVKYSLAKPLLTDPKNSLDSVAQKIGFSEQSSFTRAFKRWSNMTPGQFRKQFRG